MKEGMPEAFHIVLDWNGARSTLTMEFIKSVKIFKIEIDKQSWVIYINHFNKNMIKFTKT